MALTINGRRIVSRVEISWDDGERSNVTSIKPGTSKETFSANRKPSLYV